MTRNYGGTVGPPRRIRRAAVVGVALALVSSCTAEPTEPTRGPTREPSASDVARLELSKEPLWRGDADGLPDVMRAGFGSARFVGGLLLLEQDRSTIAVVAPDTGRPVWTVDPELRVGTTAKGVELDNATGRAPVAEIGGEPVLFAGYLREQEPSVAAVRVRDADPLWTMSDDYGVADADSRLVVLTGDGPVAVGLDAATGTQRWETPAVWPRFVAGDRVVGVVSSQEPDKDAADSTVVGLDAATGRQMWSLADRYARSAVALVAGDVALVYARPADAKTDRDAAVLIDVSSGAEITRLGWDWGARTTCASDETWVIACTLDEELGQHPGESTRLVTFDVETRQSHAAQAAELSDAEVRAVWGRYVFVRDGHVMWAVDHDGARVSDDLPGDLIGIDDRHAVVRLPGRALVPATYAVR